MNTSLFLLDENWIPKASGSDSIPSFDKPVPSLERTRGLPPSRLSRIPGEERVPDEVPCSG